MEMSERHIHDMYSIDTECSSEHESSGQVRGQKARCACANFEHVIVNLKPVVLQ